MQPLGKSARALAVCGGLAAASAQSLQWVPMRELYQRHGHALAYDERRDRTVLFGGVDQRTNFADTWEWDGRGWIGRSPGSLPPPRSGHALVYDGTRHRVVLFGGVNQSTYLSDTWEWDGIDWTLRPAAPPPARAQHAMAWDSARQRAVLFGGATGPSRHADTWEWDGTTWIRLAPAVSPPAATGAAMAFDATRQRIVLFGGETSSALLDDTWEWDGATWSRLVPRTRPRARSGAGMAFDARRNRTVMFGGTGLPLPDTWEWDGSDWLYRASPTLPPWRSRHALAYDKARQRVVMFGGTRDPVAGVGLGDTYEWDGNDWSLRHVSAAPRGPSLEIAHDLARDRTVLVTSLGSAAPIATFESEGEHWVPRSPATSPAGRDGMALVYDAARRRTVLFGGFELVTMFNDTWEWDGSTWSLRTPRASPPGRAHAAIAYDPGRQRVLMFGGHGGSGWLHRDTWEWDGTDWLQHPTSGPPLRPPMAAAYDGTRRRVVLCGVDGSSQVAMWEWDGANWLQRVPVVVPTLPFLDLAMAHDEARGRTVLVTASGGSLATETWEWDGTQWARQGANLPTGGLAYAAMAYAAVSRRILLVLVDSRLVRTAWRYGIPPTAQAVGTGCRGSSGLPRLTAGIPFLGNASFTLDLSSVRGNAPCVFGLDTALQSLALGGGCTLYLGLRTPLFLGVPSNSAGFASVPVPVPANPSLRRTTLFAQAAVADPLGPVLGLAFSEGVRVGIGD